jgi:ribose transport system substrate-binding protein
VPDGLEPGKDYAAVVSADKRGNGVVSAHLLAKELGGTGKIGLIFHEADFFVTQQRYDGFKSTITENYPDIKIIAERGIAGPDFAGDAQKVADALISQNPDLAAIWVVWDVPAEGVMAAARSGGRPDLRIATQDLGTNVAIALAQNQLVTGLGAQLPYDQGVAEANLAAAALLGDEVPPYVAVPALPVTHENVLEAWRLVYHSEPPSDLTNSFKG